MGSLGRRKLRHGIASKDSYKGRSPVGREADPAGLPENPLPLHTAARKLELRPAVSDLEHVAPPLGFPEPADSQAFMNLQWVAADPALQVSRSPAMPARCRAFRNAATGFVLSAASQSQLS